MSSPKRRASPVLACQIGAVVAGLAALAFAPPAHGAILLLPLGHDAGAATLPAALATDASLMGPGPTPASLIVYGDRAALAAATHGKPILVLAAPFAACGRA